MKPEAALVPARLALAVALVFLASCGGGEGGSDPAATGPRPQALAAAPTTFFPNVTIPTNANTIGMWSPVYNWPVISVHTTILPDGRVLTFGSSLTGQQGAYNNYDIWDSTGAPDAGHLNVSNGTGTDIFCSSQILLAPESPGSASSLFIAGGDVWTGSQTTNTANQNTTLLDTATGALTRRNNLLRPRWYSTSTTLPNGEVYIQGGLSGEDRPEIRSLTGTQRLLDGVDTSALQYAFPRNFVAPDGRVFGYDTYGQMYFVNASGNGTITRVGTLASQYASDSGSAALYRPGRILQLGGNSNSVAVIDITGATPVVTATQSLASQRQWVNATILADGKVLATSGSQVRNELTGYSTKAEIWNPTTGQWLQGPSAVKPRLYHSNAILLPDASVLVTGGGATVSVGTGPADNLNSEIYYPPYFFTTGGQRASRPIIDSAPNWVDIGTVAQVAVSNAQSVSRVTLVKTGASTHSFNMDQRFLDLTYTASGTNLSVQMPTRAADATPGYYMLFVFDEAGTPSVSKIVRMGIAQSTNTAVTPVITNPGAQAGDAGNAVSLPISASDPNGDVLRFTASGLPGGLAIDAATGTISGTPTAAGSYSVTVTASDGVNLASANFAWTVNAVNGVVLATPQPVAAVQSGTDVQFTASATGGTGVQYRWNFGDGTGDSAWSASPSITHNFAGAGTFNVTVTVTDSSGVVRSRSFLQTVSLPLTANKPAVSGNILFETPASGNARVWVVNQDNDSITAFDAVTRAKLAEVTVGAAPRAIALSPSGQLWVTNKRGDSISVVNPATFAVASTIALPRASQPFGIAMSPTAAQAFVVLEATGQLLRFDTTTFAQTGSVAVGANPRHVSVTADGANVYVSRFITPPLPGESTATVTTTPSTGGEVAVYSAGGLSLLRTVVLQHSERTDFENQGRGIPNYLGAVAISPDGTQAWVPSKQDNIKRGALRDGNGLNFQNTVRAISSRIVLSTNQEDLAKRVDHDNSSLASAAVYDSRGVYLFVALETSREVAVVDAHGGFQVMRFDAGRAPQGLALSADGKTLFVNNFMDRTVGVYDLQPLVTNGQLSVPLLATLGAVGSEKLTAPVLLGKQFFYDARDTRIARDRYMSCASCHNDGGSDGRTWDFTGQGEGLRNTIALRGRSGAQGLLHWSGNFDEVQDFEGQMRALAGGSGLMSNTSFNAGTRSQPLGDPKAGVSSDLDALAAYVSSLTTTDRSPNRDAAGALSATGAAGKAVFAAQGCGGCHGGTAFTNSGLLGLQNVGTLKASSGQRLGAVLTGIDIPTLRDVWQTAPYLHDGSAATLEQAVLAHSNVTSITSGDLASLVQYLKEIGSEETSAPGSQLVGMKLAMPLNDGGGLVAADASGTGHNGTLLNGPAWTTSGKYGGALTFDGVDDALSVANSASIDLGGFNFTLELWFKRAATGGTQQRHLFSKCAASTWESGCKELYFYGDQLRFGSFATGDTIIGNVADTGWHHLALVFTRSTNALQVYLDGTSILNATKALEADNPAHQIMFGNLHSVNPFAGALDELRIYDQALNAAAVVNDMNSAIGNVSTPDGVAPSVAISSPAAGATVSGSVNVSASASDNVGVAGVQFMVDGVNIGAELSAAPYTVSWNTTGAANGSHQITARARDAAGNVTTSAAVAVTVSNASADATPPTVSVNAPTAGATVGGTVNVSATASDNVGVAGVQFLLDGAALGAEVTAAPYTVSWNTAGSTNGTHTLSARARDAAGNQTTSSTVSVTVSNSVAAGLITGLGFDEGSGTTSADLSGGGHVATLVNGPTWATGQFGKAISFDGVDDAVTLANASTIDLGASNFTVAMWFKRNALGGSTQRHLFSKCSASTWQTGCKEFYFSGNVLNFGSFATGDTVSVTVADTSWHHVALVFTRSTNAVQIYLDGTLRTSATKALEADNAAHVFTLGNLQNGNPFSGLIDEVRIYNAALTAAQVGTAMSTPLTPVNDTTPPVVSGGTPSGTLAAGTTQTTLGVATDESATCRYATAAGTPYASMGSSFGTTGGTAHSTLVTGLVNGQSYTYYVRCQDTAGNPSTTDVAISFSVATPDTTAPTVSLGAPTEGATVVGTVSVTANAGDNIGVAGVQFLLDGVALGAEDTTAPYAVSWNSTTATNGAHVLTARARDAAGNQTTSTAVNVTVSNTDSTAPTVSLTAPTAGATVTGTVNVTASASDNVGVAGVQFLLDGVALGSEVTAAPYTLSWNSTTASNGAHALSARARDAAGNTTTSGAVSVTVSNVAASGLVVGLGLNEGTGTTAADLSGSGHAATLVNGPTWAAGQYGNAVSFDGVNDQLSVAAPSTINLGSSNFTLMMWVKRSALGGSAQRHLFAKCHATAWQTGCKELYFAGNTLRFGSFTTSDVNSATINDTAWHHIAVVFTRATNAVQIYVDGTLRTTATRNLEADNAAHVVTIGAMGGANFFSGLIDEVRVYNQALTAAQVGTARSSPL